MLVERPPSLRSGNTIWPHFWRYDFNGCKQVTFPLTPALSLGERENRYAVVDQIGSACRGEVQGFNKRISDSLCELGRVPPGKLFFQFCQRGRISLMGGQSGELVMLVSFQVVAR
jgi:hypothetical protein